MTFQTFYSRTAITYSTASLLLSDLPELVTHGAGLISTFFLAKSALDIAIGTSAWLGQRQSSDEVTQYLNSLSLPPHIITYLISFLAVFNLLTHAGLTISSQYFLAIFFFVWFLSDLFVLILSWKNLKNDLKTFLSSLGDKK